MKKETKLITAGRNSKKYGGSVNPRIQKTSTVIFPTIKAYEDAEKGQYYYEETKDLSTADYTYGISGTETAVALQVALSEMEGGGKTFLAPSGLSAIVLALTSFIRQGDHILLTDTVYGPTRRFCTKELRKFGVEVTYYDPYIGADIKKLIKPNTKVVFMESPGSLTFEVQDVPAICKAAKQKSKDIVTIIDNSWATALYFQPFDSGVDVSVQALTKYIGGHSDILLGSVSAKDESCIKKIATTFRNLGLHSSPEDCYLAQRGLRTLAVRLKQHQENATEITRWLQKRKEVAKVLYPALSDSPDHKIWKRDFTGASGLFSFVFNKSLGKEAIYKFVDNCELFSVGCSWGGFESLILHIDPSRVRTATKWNEKGTLIRLYAGLENVDDLIKDLEKGFSRISKSL